MQKAFQKAIDEQGEMEDKKSQNTPTIDSVIGIGLDIIQPTKIDVKEVVSHEGADAQEASATEANVPESKQGTSPVISIAAELNSFKSPVEDPEFTVAVAAQSKSSDGTAEGPVVIRWYSQRAGRKKQVIGGYSRNVGQRKEVIRWFSRSVG
jgi:hypothetical protein